MPVKIDWVAFRHIYETTKTPVPEILKQFRTTRHHFTRHRIDEGWTSRPSAVARHASVRPAATSADEPATITDPPATGPKRKSTTISQRRALVARLTTAIETKLKLLERRFEREMAGLDQATGTTRAKALSAADFERDTRAIGQLIKNLEHVTEYDHDQQLGKRLSGAAAKSASLATSALADEADRLRRELGERLQRLVDPAKDATPTGVERT